MPTPQQRELLHLFDNSICPDPNVFVFIGFTIFTLLWILFQSIVASQPRPSSTFRSVASTAFFATTYTAALVIQLLDGCWFAVLYGWWLSKIAQEGSFSQGVWGLVEWIVTGLILCVLYVFLVAVFLLWVVTILRTLKQLMLLWSRGVGRVSEVIVSSETVSAPGDSK
jgi:hypothetical protein